MSHKHENFPFIWENWDSCDNLDTQFYDVEFTDDFGIFKKGQKVDILIVEFTTNSLKSYNGAEENPDIIQKFTTIPVTDEISIETVENQVAALKAAGWKKEDFAERLKKLLEE